MIIWCWTCRAYRRPSPLLTCRVCEVCRGVVVTPAELRAEAKALRKRAKDLDAEADSIELAAAAERRRLNSRAAHEAKAATMCRPVWKSEGLDGVYVVVAIEDGCFMLRNLQSVENTPPLPYRVRDGRLRGGFYGHTSVLVQRAVLDHVATMLAWREWCATRRASEAQS